VKKLTTLKTLVVTAIAIFSPLISTSTALAAATCTITYPSPVSPALYSVFGGTSFYTSDLMVENTGDVPLKAYRMNDQPSTFINLHSLLNPDTDPHVQGNDGYVGGGSFHYSLGYTIAPGATLDAQFDWEPSSGPGTTTFGSANKFEVTTYALTGDDPTTEAPIIQENPAGAHWFDCTPSGSTDQVVTETTECPTGYTGTYPDCIEPVTPPPPDPPPTPPPAPGDPITSDDLAQYFSIGLATFMGWLTIKQFRWRQHD
jgi:hypothetical protein